MQDGPEVWLICRIRFLLRVTEADQGAQVITTRCKTQKPIMEQKDDQGYNHYKHNATHPKQESQRQKSTEPKGPSGEVYNRVNAMNAQNEQ